MKAPLYIVMLIAQSTDMNFQVFSKPIAACRDLNQAKKISEAEAQLNNRLVVEGKECSVIAGVLVVPEIEVPSSAKECWVTWSIAMMRDGTGRTMSKLEGVFGKQESAENKKKTVPQGEQLVAGFLGEVKTEVTRVKLV